MKTESKNIRSAKRKKNERVGIHSWHPYYAGYSEIFVDDMLNYFGASKDSIVLDPWMGSGTTALVCQRRGIQSLGNELNPVMVIFSRAKTAKLLKLDLVQITNLILDYVDLQTISVESVVDNEYITSAFSQKLQAIRKAIDTYIQTSDLSDLDENVRAFYYAVLFRCIRSIGGFSTGSNPTWLIKSIPALSEDHIDVNKLFKQLAFSMIEDLSMTFDDILGDLQPVPNIVEGDSRFIQFDSDSVDFVITSPPYLTRIDYAVSTKPELLFLGYEESAGFDHIRRNTMGAPVISDKGIQIDPMWGPTCIEFLSNVENHPSKASKSYYLPIFLQYFRDAISSLQEINRVLHVGGKACLVVQSSFYKDVEARLGEMYVEMGESLGMESYIVSREVVKNHIAHVNTRSSIYVKNKVYHEDAVIFKKR